MSPHFTDEGGPGVAEGGVQLTRLVPQESAAVSPVRRSGSKWACLQRWAESFPSRAPDSSRPAGRRGAASPAAGGMTKEQSCVAPGATPERPGLLPAGLCSAAALLGPHLSPGLHFCALGCPALGKYLSSGKQEPCDQCFRARRPGTGGGSWFAARCLGNLWVEPSPLFALFSSCVHSRRCCRGTRLWAIADGDYRLTAHQPHARRFTRVISVAASRSLCVCVCVCFVGSIFQKRRLDHKGIRAFSCSG